MWPFPKRSVDAPVSTPTKQTGYVVLSGYEDEDNAKSKSEYRGAASTRVQMKDLEIDYARDPICFAGVNWISALTASNGWDLSGDDADVKVVKEWMGRMRFELWVKRIAMHLAIYGVTFNEIVPNKEGTIISSLNPIDPKSMDFSKTKDALAKEVLDLDGYGKPKFYVQHPYDWDGTMNAGIKFKPSEILYIPMRMIADSLWGVGILEPIHEITKIKMNIERALGEAIYRLGFPIPIAYLGDKEHDPTPNDSALMTQRLKKMNNMSNLSLPFYNKIDFYTPSLQGMRDHLDYYVEQQIAGIGLPKSVVTGTGQGTNRATLEELTDIAARNIDSIHHAIEEGLNQMIFKKMVEWGQLTGPVTIKFKPLKVDEKMVKITAIVDLVNAGAMTPDAELEDWARKYLELPERTGDFQPQQPISKIGQQVGANIADAIGKSKPY